METLFELKSKAERLIAERGLDRFKIMGAIGVRCGFVLGMISQGTEGDAQMVRNLREAIDGILLRPDHRAAVQLLGGRSRIGGRSRTRRTSGAARMAS